VKVVIFVFATAGQIAFLTSWLLAAEPDVPLMLEGAQPDTQAERVLPSPYSGLPLDDSAQAPVVDQPLIEGYEPIGTPEWTSSPYRHSGWRFGLMPSISSDEDDEFWLRANLGYEHPDGVGNRAEFWLYNDEFNAGFGRVDFWASTLYLDHYKRFYYHDAELVLGGGLAVGHLAFDSTKFYGGGGSLVAEGFLPFFNGKRSDLGLVGKGRVAGLFGGWDKGSINTSLDDDWALLVEEFSWGLEFRRQLVKENGGYWFINLMREHRLWDEADLSASRDILIQGTVLNFGAAW
jgi:hypothetical protein